MIKYKQKKKKEKGNIMLTVSTEAGTAKTVKGMYEIALHKIH